MHFLSSKLQKNAFFGRYSAPDHAKMVNGFRYYTALESVINHSVSFVYRSYQLPMPDPSQSTLTV